MPIRSFSLPTDVLNHINAKANGSHYITELVRKDMHNAQEDMEQLVRRIVKELLDQEPIEKDLKRDVDELLNL